VFQDVLNNSPQYQISWKPSTG